MKPILLENVISYKELFFLYKELMAAPSWTLLGRTGDVSYQSNKRLLSAPQMVAKNNAGDILNYPLYLLGQTLIFRIEEILKSKKIGIATNMVRMWFNVTYHGKETQHWLHPDDFGNDKQTIVLFMTPIWQPDWKGSFYVDGEEFKFKPGSAVIFSSKEYHTGESPDSETQNWQRLTCNIVVEHKKE